MVGGGLAGLRAAVGLASQCDVAVVSKVHPVRSHSGAAQGGINAALGNAPEGRDDSPERHAFDTIKGSDYLADQSAVVEDVRTGAGDDLRVGALGRALQPVRRRHDRPAAFRRRRLSADLLRRRPHRPRAAAHALRTGRQARRHGLRRTGRDPAGRRRRALPRAGRATT